MINIEKFFNELDEKKAISPEAEKVLNAIMTIKNPMKFDDTIATEEQLDNLEKEIANMLAMEPIKLNFYNTIKSLRPVRAPIPFI